MPASAMRQDRVPKGVFTRDGVRPGQVIDCEVVVVGSGAGGATVAAELAEAGFDVIVVEEGRYFSTRDFTANASDMVRTLYRDAGTTMAVGRPPILYQEGRAVGGSTVINGGMSWRTPERILAEWRESYDVDWLDDDTMNLYFERVERRIHVGHQDPESVGRDNQLLREGAERKGWDVIPNLRNQVHCPGSNNCAFGCPTGAKQSALVSYIPRALHFGARVYSDLRAMEILRRGKRATGVRCHIMDRSYRSAGEVTIRAPIVVVACGSIHTPALLWRSGFKSPSGRLGKNLSLHPNIKVVAVMDQPVRGWEGVHQGYQVREFGDQGISTLAAVNVPPSILALAMPQYGDELGAMLDQYDHMMIAGALIEDNTTGAVRRAPGGLPVATYELAKRDAAAAVEAARRLSELLFEVGAKRVFLPFTGLHEISSPDQLGKIDPATISRESMEVLTVHMMGTAAMGGDRSHAVTDSFGHVYDAEGLVIADASLFPGPVGVNPMETIMALATRNAHYLIENRTRYLS
ncbi:MAG: GMC family oxidoreductase [Deltaproteobacteria bacterium]|nr:GMC family oxidoreductase [Deltaproteobacteria bacterium]